jgi:hypothetical protein
MRQQESEPLEEFSQRIYFMALDGFDKGNPEVVDQIATMSIQRGTFLWFHNCNYRLRRIINN